MKSFDDITKFLDECSTRLMFSKHWICNLIYPALFFLLYISAEREGDFPLHLRSCNKVISYSFSADHTHYTRYGICYLRAMKTLPGHILDSFLKAQHIIYHQLNLLNGIRKDLAIENL